MLSQWYYHVASSYLVRYSEFSVGRRAGVFEVCTSENAPFWLFWCSLLLNWQFACSGLLFGSSSILWMYIVKHYPLSVAYPMISLSYVFGLLAAILFFHESVSVMKWVGVSLIILGCCLIAK